MPAAAKPFDVSIIEMNPDGSVRKATFIAQGDEAPTTPDESVFNEARGGPDVVRRMMNHQRQVAGAAAANKSAE